MKVHHEQMRKTSNKCALYSSKKWYRANLNMMLTLKKTNMMVFSEKKKPHYDKGTKESKA